MKVNEYLMSDVAREYDDYSISVQDQEGNILYYGDKYNLISYYDEYGDLLVLKTEENKKEKYLIFMTL